MAYVIGPISGCHINPAITLGMWLTRKVDLRQAVYAWVAQVLGGIFGAAVIYGIASGRDGLGARRRSRPTGGTATGSAGSARRSSSRSCSRRCSCSSCCRRPAGASPPGFGGLTAGITLAVIHLVTIPVDNTGVNPARSLATAIFADTDPSALGQLWVFIVFPLIGSVVGVFVWLLVDEATLESTMLDTDMLRRTRDALDDVVDDVFDDDDDSSPDATKPGP